MDGLNTFQLHHRPGGLKRSLSRGLFGLTVLQISVGLPGLRDSISRPCHERVPGTRVDVVLRVRMSLYIACHRVLTAGLQGCCREEGSLRSRCTVVGSGVL